MNYARHGPKMPCDVDSDAMAPQIDFKPVGCSSPSGKVPVRSIIIGLNPTNRLRMIFRHYNHHLRASGACRDMIYHQSMTKTEFGLGDQMCHDLLRKSVTLHLQIIDFPLIACAGPADFSWVNSRILCSVDRDFWKWDRKDYLFLRYKCNL